MVKHQEDLSAQGIGRLDIQKIIRLDPGTETFEVWGEIEVLAQGRTAAGYVYARNLHLKSIENLLLTADTGAGATVYDVFATKQIPNKGRKSNYASIFVWDANAGTLLSSGSVYLNFLAMGE